MSGVLWAIKGLGRGGAEQLLVASARLADHQHHHYEVCFVLARKAALVGELSGLGVPVHALGGQGRRRDRLLWPWRLRQLLRTGGFDVVHAHSPVVAVAVRVAVLTLPGHRLSTVYTQHNVWQSYAWATRVADLVTCRRDRHRFAVSPTVASSSPSRVSRGTETLIHGIDPTRQVSPEEGTRSRVRTELGLPETGIVLVTVANLRTTKDHANLLRALVTVRAARPDVHHLVVGDGPLREELVADTHALGLAEAVRFLGQRPDVPDLLIASDVFVLASRHEGLPIAMMEAMRAGLPSVLTRVGGIPDVIEHGREALLVPPEDPAALAAAILAVCRDPVLRGALGERARQLSVRFDLTAAVRGYERVYDEVVLSRREMVA